MSIQIFPFCAVVLSVSVGAAWADTPRIVTDIPPVHSLTARVMEGVGTPDLLVDGATSPHDFALRPSQAAALAEADLVIWVGEALTPALAGSMSALAERAELVELMAVEGAVTHAYRESVGGDHDHDHDHAADHGDDTAHDHDSHAHDDHDHDAHETAAHETAAHDDHHHDHDHSGMDPHGWLDPANAILWTGVIADRLADMDPANAAVYQANARAAEAELTQLQAEIAERFGAGVQPQFVVFHDAYQYFETAFGLAPIGAISLSEAEAPSAARVAEIRDRIGGLGAICVFAEPQFDPRIVAAVTEDTPARTAVIDPLGAQLEPGPELYPALMRAMTESFASCG
ncbi:zinc ABC transporter substrate-binding protein [Boseongicola sp. H5]|uniref:zinc ABC transporter substrate-binding protein n=1 Tax=Boseongicola sp. H5 TaxID=2763261 RepID=UPI001D0B5374|nr:zinc ABC transporter substrate-binding protein [Boseongicola sp. H5]